MNPYVLGAVMGLMKSLKRAFKKSSTKGAASEPLAASADALQDPLADSLQAPEPQWSHGHAGAYVPAPAADRRDDPRAWSEQQPRRPEGSLAREGAAALNIGGGERQLRATMARLSPVARAAAEAEVERMPTMLRERIGHDPAQVMAWVRSRLPDLDTLAAGPKERPDVLRRQKAVTAAD